MFVDSDFDICTKSIYWVTQHILPYTTFVSIVGDHLAMCHWEGVHLVSNTDVIRATPSFAKVNDSFVHALFCPSVRARNGVVHFVDWCELQSTSGGKSSFHMVERNSFEPAKIHFLVLKLFAPEYASWPFLVAMDLLATTFSFKDVESRPLQVEPLLTMSCNSQSAWRLESNHPLWLHIG